MGSLTIPIPKSLVPYPLPSDLPQVSAPSNAPVKPHSNQITLRQVPPEPTPL